MEILEVDSANSSHSFGFRQILALPIPKWVKASRTSLIWEKKVRKGSFCCFFSVNTIQLFLSCRMIFGKVSIFCSSDKYCFRFVPRRSSISLGLNLDKFLSAKSFPTLFTNDSTKA